MRAAEVHRYQAVIVENVPDVIDRWKLFAWWLAGIERLGCHWQLISVSSAHIHRPGNPPAPQWRDRLYIVFTRTGIPRPDVIPRPLSLCAHCGADVAARAGHPWPASVSATTGTARRSASPPPGTPTTARGQDLAGRSPPSHPYRGRPARHRHRLRPGVERGVRG
jgi:hypothetical protein